MLAGVRLFISAVFFVLGASFLVTTGVLLTEFHSTGALAIAAFYSHLFVFFPTFGIVALFAFYTPATAFLDMYWRHVPFGRLRFVVGLAVVGALSWMAAGWLAGSDQRSVFEVGPQALARDGGDPEGCSAGGGAACRRMPILAALENVRQVSQSRIGLSDLSRTCRPDPLIESAAAPRRRFCFAATPLGPNARLLDDGECCRAQQAFTAAVNARASDPATRSTTAAVHAALLPLKVFFLLMLVVISALLALRRKALEQYYSPWLPAIERGVLIGAAALVVYPVMSHAFLQSAALLYGEGSSSAYRSNAPFLSFLFGGWGLMLVFFFWSRRDKEMQSLGRIGGIAGGSIAVVKYDVIIDVFVRLFGSGAGRISLAVLSAAALAAIVVLLMRERAHGALPDIAALPGETDGESTGPVAAVDPVAPGSGSS